MSPDRTVTHVAGLNRASKFCVVVREVRACEDAPGGRDVRRWNDRGGGGDTAEQDWKVLHHRLRSIAQQRIALEAKEIGYLVEAEEAQLHRRLGYATLLESQD